MGRMVICYNKLVEGSDDSAGLVSDSEQAAKLEKVRSLYDGRGFRMTEQATATEAGMEQVSKEKLMADLRAVIADAEELLKATANQAGERITAARAKAEESLKAAKARLLEEQAAMMAKTKAAAASADEYVRAHPWQAVGIAAVAGLILGILASRR